MEFEEYIRLLPKRVEKISDTTFIREYSIGNEKLELDLCSTKELNRFIDEGNGFVYKHSETIGREEIIDDKITYFRIDGKHFLLYLSQLKEREVRIYLKNFVIKNNTIVNNYHLNEYIYIAIDKKN